MRGTVSTRFVGKKRVRIDGKGRVSVPAAFRPVLERGDPERGDGGARIFVTFREREPFLTCLTAAHYDATVAEIEAMHEGDLARIALEEVFFENIVEMQLDDAGRVILPADLRERYGLEGEVVFGGRGRTFRIYSEQAPEIARSALEQRMAELPEGASVFSLLPGAPVPARPPAPSRTD
jgi:MraZ protein